MMDRLESTLSAFDLTDAPSTTVHPINVAELSSSLQHFGFVDYFVFVLMLVVCAVIGFYFGFIEKKKKSGGEQRRGSEALDYLVGGRKMKVLPVALSLVASFVSGISLLGTSTEIYVYGTQYAFILVTLVISGIISWYVFLPVFCNLQITSTYEIFWLPIVIYVPALAFNQVTGVNIHIVTPVVCIVCIFYTCVGGLKAVVWTDVIQTIIMVGSIVLVIIKGTVDVGGLAVVWKRNLKGSRLELPEMTWDPSVRVSMLSVFLGATLFYVQVTSGNQVIMQRYLSLPGMKEVKAALIWFTIGIIALMGACFYNGLLLYATYYNCDPLSTKLAKVKDQLVPLLVMNTLGVFPGMAGLFVAGVFSAALSSLSTGLNSLAAVILEDYIKPLRRSPLSERQTAYVMRLSVILVGILCVILVFVVERMGTVLQLSMTLGSITSGPLLGLFLIGVLMPWINGKSALVGSIASTCITAWICFRAQLAISEGEIHYNEKPVSTYGCEYLFENFTMPIKAVENSSKKPLQYIYHISFMLYVAVGTFLTVVFAGLMIPFLGHNDPKNMNMELLAPFMRKILKRSDYLKYFELRFGREVRYFGSMLFIVGMVLWLPVAVYVPALTFNQVSGIDIHIITPIVCLICTFYTCVGGLKAVIWTDVVQSFVMYGSILVICIKGTIDVGGIDVVLKRNSESGRLNTPDWTWDPTVRLSMLAVFVGGSLHKIQSSAVNQICIQRYLSLPSFKKAKQTVIAFNLLLMFLMLCCCYMGLLAYASYYDCDPLSTKLASASDQLPTLLVMKTVGHIRGLPGLFVAGVFSAALSSLSTGLNSLACVISQDVIAPLLKTPLNERQTAILLRLIVFGFGVACIGLVYIVEKLGMVLQLATMTGAVTMGPLLAVYTMGVVLPWINGKSALTGCIAGFLVLSWICANAQIAQMKGEITYPKMPVSIDGCTYEFDNETAWHVIHDYKPSTSDQRNLYHISFLWYSALGAIISVIVAAIATGIFGTTNLRELDPALVSPFMRRFLPVQQQKEYFSVSLEDFFNDKSTIEDKKENAHKN